MDSTQTRQLGIEFERRIQTLDPTTEVANKLDTETIYSFLNEYQMRYVQTLLSVSSLKLTEEQSVNKLALSRVQAALRINSVLATSSQIYAENGTVEFELPENFMQYIVSFSITNHSYIGDTDDSKRLINTFITNAEFDSLYGAAYDEDRVVRRPLCTIVADVFKIGYDRYTLKEVWDEDEETYVIEAPSIQLYYYRKPNFFSPLTEQNCDLPIECFEDLVQGAVDLYIATKYRLALAQQNNNRRKTRDE